MIEVVSDQFSVVSEKLKAKSQNLGAHRLLVAVVLLPVSLSTDH